MAVSPITAAIIQGAKARGLDPNAVIAVSKQEGLSGGIGDGGHAFGPFQENDAGGVLTGRFPGENPAQLQAWAESPAGINDALNRIAKVASGLHGAQAVDAIVSRFERPANIPREEAGALSSYGAPLPSGAAITPGPVATTPHAAPLAGTNTAPIAAALRLLAQSSGGSTKGPVAPTLAPVPVTPFQATSSTPTALDGSLISLLSPTTLLSRFAAAPRTQPPTT